ncbi:hypothetical protein IAU60_000466 [Kwoniella sp. DSM 27419]
MSLFPSLRAQAQASSSTLLSFSRPLLATGPQGYIPLTSRRHASTEAKKPAQNPFASRSRSIQEVEKELEEQRAMLARAARTNPGMDIGNQTIPVLEPYIDPKKPLWYFLPFVGDKAYKTERKERSDMTRQSLGEIIARRGFEEHRKSFLSGTAAPIRNAWLIVRRSAAIQKTMASFGQRYQEYQKVLAEGTIGQAQSISKDTALAAATYVIRRRKDKLRWQLIKENAKPYLVSSRLTIVDPRDMRMAAQMVVRFDTEQALITQKGNSTPTRRTQRVVENIIFEAFPINRHTEWKIKGKLIEPSAEGGVARAE